MTTQQIKDLIGDGFWPKDPPEAISSPEDWAAIQARFGCAFPPEFPNLQELIFQFSFEGDYLRIAPHARDGDISSVCEAEAKTGRSLTRAAALVILTPCLVDSVGIRGRRVMAP